MTAITVSLAIRVSTNDSWSNLGENFFQFKLLADSCRAKLWAVWHHRVDGEDGWGRVTHPVRLCRIGVVRLFESKTKASAHTATEALDFCNVELHVVSYTTFIAPDLSLWPERLRLVVYTSQLFIDVLL